MGIDGRAGLAPQLVLKGKLIAKGYGVGAVVQIMADVTASTSPVRTHSWARRHQRLGS